MIHEWWGLNDFVKGKADGFAKQGYVALAVDLYRGKVATDAGHGAPADARPAGGPRGAGPEGRGRVPARAARRRRREDRRRSAGAWAAATRSTLALAEPTLAGAVIYYGHLMTDPATIAGLKVPLLGNFGGQDQGIPPESVQAFEAAAKKAGKSVDFKIYPGRRATRFASSKDPKVFRPADAKDADARTDAFLAKVLKE